MAEQPNAGTASRLEPKPRNIILILTDQERAIQWFPVGWEEENLPAMTFLKKHGISFLEAANNTCACTPSRATIVTGTYPSRNLSNFTLTEFFQPDADNATPYNDSGDDGTVVPTAGPYPADLSFGELQLDQTLPNLATILAEAGYETFYKGKYHLSKGVLGYDNYLYEPDIARYGFREWDPPDAGQDAQIQNYGGGTADHDHRFTNETLAFLRDRIENEDKYTKPFCLVFSLVNPHDVLGYPTNWESREDNGGYGPEDLAGDIDLPPRRTLDEDLSENYKPTCQEEWLKVMNAGMGPLPGPRSQAYINFYGNLMKRVDGEIKEVLDLLSDREDDSLWKNTMIVRTSDHGEMGLTHGGSRQKWFNAYQESIKVPLVWSNPVMFPEPVVSDALVTLVDLLPTLASFVGVENPESFGMQGLDYSSILENPDESIQDYTYFINTDVKAGQAIAQAALPPNHLAMVRDSDFKYVRYYGGTTIKGATSKEEQDEFYNLKLPDDTDQETGEPLEYQNKSEWAVAQGAPWEVDSSEEEKRTEMQALLHEAMTDGVLATQPRKIPPLAMKPRAKKVTNAWSDANEEVYQVICYSQHSYRYTLQILQDDEWCDVPSTTELIPTTLEGNNGPFLFQAQPVQNPRPTYRVARAGPGPKGAVTCENVVWEDYTRA